MIFILSFIVFRSSSVSQIDTNVKNLHPNNDKQLSEPDDNFFEYDFNPDARNNNSPPQEFANAVYTKTLQVSNCEIKIHNCAFVNISRTSGQGGPINLNCPEFTVTLNHSLMHNCYSALGSAGGRIMCHNLQINGICIANCHTDRSFKVQAIETNCKVGNTYNIAIDSCAPANVQCGFTCFLFKCPINEYKVQHINFTNNNLAGEGTFLKHIDTSYCATVYAHIANNRGVNSTLIGEGTSLNCVMAFRTNYINNTIRIFFNFEAGRAKQITYSTFIQNKFVKFFGEVKTTTMQIEHCDFDNKLDDLGYAQFTYCIFNDQEPHTAILQPIGDGECSLSPTPIPTPIPLPFFQKYKLYVIIGSSIVAVLLVVTIIALIIHRRRVIHQQQMDDLAFTGAYFRRFANSTI